MEDPNLVISIQRKFNYLQSIPGIFTVQRGPETSSYFSDKNRYITGAKRLFDEAPEQDGPSIKSMNLGWNSPLNGGSTLPVWPIPSLLPGVSCSLGALLSKFPYSVPPYNPNEDGGDGVEICGIKMEPSCHLEGFNMITEEKPRPTNLNKGVKDQVFGGLGF